MANGCTICSLARQRECQGGKNLADGIVLPHPVGGALVLDGTECLQDRRPSRSYRMLGDAMEPVLPSCDGTTQNCTPSRAGNRAKAASERVAIVYEDQWATP